MNPWNLTAGEMVALDAYMKHGSEKCAAYALARDTRTISTQLTRARGRIGAKTRVEALLTYARWKWEQETA